MKILINKDDLNEALNKVSKLGFVPTMGSIHKGHLSLIKRSIKECNKTIVSIFVNPTQFNNKKDYQNYPRNNKKDLSILKQMKIDFLYLPHNNDVYSSKKGVKIKLNRNDKILCAKFRNGHFEGVIDVMTRLTNSIKPYKIFMGEKDFQQLYLVKKYLKKNFKSKIIPCKTIRDKGNLALSSRNFLLTKLEIKKARKFTQALFSLKKKLSRVKNIEKFLIIRKKELSKLFNLKIEYLELRNKINLKKTNRYKNSRIFFAYYINNIRLIDNF
jgi:pantoate--beta-alanine ligase